jgi:hypothetical protein
MGRSADRHKADLGARFKPVGDKDAMWCELRFGSTRNLEGRQQMGDSIAALFKRLTQGVYVVGVAHGEMRMALLRFY